jgi:hypothetical protein
MAQELTIDAHLAEFVHQHGQTLTALQQQMAQKGGLAGAKKARDHRHRQTSGGSRLPLGRFGGGNAHPLNP